MAELRFCFSKCSLSAVCAASVTVSMMFPFLKIIYKRNPFINYTFRHSGESRIKSGTGAGVQEELKNWIPASAGMTT
jgi:hypothetical protein